MPREIPVGGLGWEVGAPPINDDRLYFLLRILSGSCIIPGVLHFYGRRNFLEWVVCSGCGIFLMASREQIAFCIMAGLSICKIIF